MRSFVLFAFKSMSCKDFVWPPIYFVSSCLSIFDIGTPASSVTVEWTVRNAVQVYNVQVLNGFLVLLSQIGGLLGSNLFRVISAAMIITEIFWARYVEPESECDVSVNVICFFHPLYSSSCPISLHAFLPFHQTFCTRICIAFRPRFIPIIPAVARRRFQIPGHAPRQAHRH
jgi:hypothetical protein